jgi:hypothetical protein
MNFVDALGAVLVGALILAGVVTVVKNGSNVANIITSFGQAESNLITAAKS